MQKSPGGDINYHWKYSGTFGSLGGFNQSTLRCAANGIAPTRHSPCPVSSAADGTSVFKFTIGKEWRQSIHDGSRGYSDWELWLMGLLPAHLVKPGEMMVWPSNAVKSR